MSIFVSILGIIFMMSCAFVLVTYPLYLIYHFIKFLINRNKPQKTYPFTGKLNPEEHEPYTIGPVFDNKIKLK